MSFWYQAVLRLSESYIATGGVFRYRQKNVQGQGQGPPPHSWRETSFHAKCLAALVSLGTDLFNIAVCGWTAVLSLPAPVEAHTERVYLCSLLWAADDSGAQDPFNQPIIAPYDMILPVIIKAPVSSPETLYACAPPSVRPRKSDHRFSYLPSLSSLPSLRDLGCDTVCVCVLFPSVDVTALT